MKSSSYIGIGVAMIGLLAAVAFAELMPPVEDFEFDCVYGGEECDLILDEAVGICRTLQFATPDGAIGVLLCHKEDFRYELYRQFSPIGKDFEVCTADGAGCVDELRGFDSFTTQEFEDGCVGPDCYCYLPVEDFNTSCAAPGCYVGYDNVIGTCRELVFNSTIGQKSVLLCHKGDSRYELYHQQGADYQVCVGKGCVAGLKGYDSFEIACPQDTEGNQTEGNQTEGNQTDGNQTDGNDTECQDCAEKLCDLPVNCTGDITLDKITKDDCRLVQCEEDESLIKVVACEKDDGDYFDIFKLKEEGDEVPKVCLADVCLQDEDYVKADFPACFEVACDGDEDDNGGPEIDCCECLAWDHNHDETCDYDEDCNPEDEVLCEECFDSEIEIICEV